MDYQKLPLASHQVSPLVFMFFPSTWIFQSFHLCYAAKPDQNKLAGFHADSSLPLQTLGVTLFLQSIFSVEQSFFFFFLSSYLLGLFSQCSFQIKQDTQTHGKSWGT